MGFNLLHGHVVIHDTPVALLSRRFPSIVTSYLNYVKKWAEILM